jgi:DNA-binding MarR family transcriptional regulator
MRDPDTLRRNDPAPPAARPSGCTSFKLRQLSRRIGQRYDAHLAKAGLKTTQYSLLSHVLRLGPIRPGELAAAMTMDASTLTRNLRPLVAAGWLEIGPGDDARSRSIRITDAGAAKRAEAQRRWRLAQDELNAALGIDRVAALHDLIDQALARLAPAAGEDDDE